MKLKVSNSVYRNKHISKLTQEKGSPSFTESVLEIPMKYDLKKKKKRQHIKKTKCVNENKACIVGNVLKSP